MQGPLDWALQYQITFFLGQYVPEDKKNKELLSRDTPKLAVSIEPLTQGSSNRTFPSIMSPQNRSFSTLTAQSLAKGGRDVRCGRIRPTRKQVWIVVPWIGEREDRNGEHFSRKNPSPSPLLWHTPSSSWGWCWTRITTGQWSRGQWVGLLTSESFDH